MRRLTVIALAVAAVACAAQETEPDSAETGRTTATSDGLMEPSGHGAADHRPVDGEAATSLPAAASEISDAAPTERDDAGGEAIGVTDEVSIVIIDPDD